MFVKENTLSAIKDYFFTSLSEVYPEREVESFFFILCDYFLSFSRIEVRTNENKNLSESELLKFHYAIKDLISFKPIQQIIGQQYFYDNVFSVSSHTLIPRPETEELVDLIVKENSGFEGRILDIGTGTGAIAISLDLAISGSSVVAFDVSKKAIETALENKNRLDSEVEFVVHDILKPPYKGDNFDIIVSNPPYVMNQEMEEMQSNVLDYEPHLALFVEDEDPLLFYKEIVKFSTQFLNKNGKLYFEINEKFGAETADLLRANDFVYVEVVKDLNGKDRIVKGNKKHEK